MLFTHENGPEKMKCINVEKLAYGYTCCLHVKAHECVKCVYINSCILRIFFGQNFIEKTQGQLKDHRMLK